MRPGDMLRLFKRDTFPTVIHFTHAKAGSTWVNGILRELFGRRVKQRVGGVPDFSNARGRIYPCVFMHRDAAIAIPAVETAKRFFILRDLRDTLISRYFSIRESHMPDPAGKIEAQRAEHRELSVEAGLLRMMESGAIQSAAKVQRSWIESSDIVLRYEDLIANDVPLFTDLFVKRLGLPVNPDEVERAVVSQRFESVFRRRLGEEDTSSHGRKGLPGDWKNHLTGNLAERFFGLYGDLLIQSGYESEPGWWNR